MAKKQIFNTSAELNYPSVLPTLDLDFANSKTLDPRITFRRSSGGSYFGPDGRLRYAGVNVPRFTHDPVTGESLGLLVEEQRTNLFTYSEQFDNAAWGKTGILVTSSSIAAPNGTLSAFLLADTAASGGHQLSFNLSANFVSGTAYSQSYYVKAAGRTKLSIDWRSNWFPDFSSVEFDLQAVTATPGANATGRIEPVRDGWYRISASAVADATGSSPSDTFLSLRDNSGNQTYTGDGTSGIYLWGAQLEAGSFPTSYIPTTTTAVTRSADVASITGAAFSSWYRQDEGTAYAEMQARLGANQSALSITEGAFTNNFRVRKNTLNNYNGVLRDGLTRDISVTPNPALTETQMIKMALAVKTGDCAVTGGGQSPALGSTFTLNTMNTLLIGGFPGVGDYVNAPIRRLTYWPQRLSNSTLQSITA